MSQYQGETYQMIVEYEKSLADLNKLLKININNAWALKVHKEVTKK